MNKKNIYKLTVFITLVLAVTLVTAITNKEKAQALFEEGNEALKAGNFLEAVSLYDQAAELDPGIAMLYNNRGLAKYGIKDYGNAIQDFDKTLELSPKMTEAFFNRGLAKHYFRDYAGAVQDMTRVIAVDSEDKEAFYIRGLSKIYMEGMAESACEDFQKARDLGHGKAGDALIKHCSEEED